MQSIDQYQTKARIQAEFLDQYKTNFAEKISPHFPLRPFSIKTLQVNVGKKCNQTCLHCHVDASPLRQEMMSEETVFACLKVLQENSDIEILDITGGAPELNVHFKTLVIEAKKLGKHIIDRCNLTILEVPDYEYLYGFLSENGVEIIASLPHFSALTTNKQRGNGVFENSIKALRKLNTLGYGIENGNKSENSILTGVSPLPLHLVYNPNGFFLSGSQTELEKEFKLHLSREFGIVFNNLYCLNNMPISRYLDTLIKRDKYQDYMETLVNAFNPATISGLMCRSMISVSYDGKLYDCDFNQMLEMPVTTVPHIKEFTREKFLARDIRVSSHCFGCTAGAGSSCGGVIG